ncbi:hypothetical protein BD626DRAFT_565077 [Schizophyllum amplum]|uniref:Uncharacterized protein n=1 Tax=Schizophyllum amplum TaxID=97359 RepID=A0A550CTW1_9AGAR|nr:hypothetical protein BD626DRAFT_565077 [Auriculariopsis ampla]
MTAPHMSESGLCAPFAASSLQAGPIPSKRGEIGFREDLYNASSPSSSTTSLAAPLPARHPADRDPLPSNTPADATAPPTTPDTPASSLPPPHKKLLRRQAAGMRLSTLVLFAIQMGVLIATAVGWGLAATQTHGLMAVRPKEDGMGSAVVFVHVAFCLATLGQLLMLERRVYALRAERWAHLHPGEILPIAHRRGVFGGGGPHIPIAPWHRPPLPTYASIVADSGARTGDVEDEIIAAPPPPAYGHTRGSTLLLSGFLRDSLRAQRPPSQHSQMSERPAYARASQASQQSRAGQLSRAHSINRLSDRPSSRSSFFSFETITQDAKRARQLEDSLAKLEGGR